MNFTPKLNPIWPNEPICTRRVIIFISPSNKNSIKQLLPTDMNLFIWGNKTMTGIYFSLSSLGNSFSHFVTLWNELWINKGCSKYSRSQRWRSYIIGEYTPILTFPTHEKKNGQDEHLLLRLAGHCSKNIPHKVPFSN